jgi:hypothetical protein
MFMTLFRNLDIKQKFYLSPDPNLPVFTKVSGSKAMERDNIHKLKPTHIVFYK